MTNPTGTQFYHNYPMGPQLRRWLGIQASAYSGDKKHNISGEEKKSFSEFLLAFIKENQLESESTLVNLMDELLAMDLPFLVLKIVDYNQEVWKKTDFRGLHAEGLAAMLSSELPRAEDCFVKAQAAAPLEPAPYVNLVRIYHYDKHWDDSLPWIDAGLKTNPNYFPLWELLLENVQAKFAEMKDILPVIKERAHSLHSWAGMSLFTDIDPLSNSQSKAAALEQFYNNGERDEAFLIEYTGALGAANQFATIPSIIWQAEKHDGKPSAWRLQLHKLQAHLALDQKEIFLSQVPSILKNPDLPAHIQTELTELFTEVQKEMPS